MNTFYITLLLVSVLIIILSFILKKRITFKHQAVRYLFVSMLLLGAIVSYFNVERLIHYESMKQFPATRGLILKSEIKGERAFHPLITYQYALDNTIHTGQTTLKPPMFGGKRKKYDVAHALVADYPVGDSVTVYYNPKDHTHTYLELQVPWDVFGQLSFGGTLYILGLIGLFFARFKPQIT